MTERGRSRRGSPAPEPHGDAGLQPERTSLAWSRTTFALLTASAIFVRWIHQHGPVTLVPLIVCLLAALGITATQRARYHRAVTSISTEWSSPSLLSIVGLAGATVLLGLLGIVVVLAG